MSTYPLRYTYLALFAALAAGWSACRKDESGFLPYDQTLDVLDVMLSEVPSSAATAVIGLSGLSRDTVLTTPAGTRIRLTDTDALFADSLGRVVPCSTCGDLEIIITEVRRKGDMLARQLHTACENGSVLDVTAMVNVRVYCEGRALSLLKDRNVAVFVASGQPLDDREMTYQGQFSTAHGLIHWRSPEASAYFAEWVTAGGDVERGYEMVQEQLGWIACGRALEAPSSVGFCVSLSAPYNVRNTRSYLVFEQANALLWLASRPGTYQYCVEAPRGYPVSVLSLSSLNNDFLLGNFKTETGTNTEANLAPVPVETSELLVFLRNL
jgi:hypothetical protein